jgi:hypothetical protein
MSDLKFLMSDPKHALPYRQALPRPVAYLLVITELFVLVHEAAHNYAGNPSLRGNHIKLFGKLLRHCSSLRQLTTMVLR